MDRWDMMIILVAAYIAVMTLVRMMARRRNQLVDHVLQQISQQQTRRPATTQSDEDADRGAA